MNVRFGLQLYSLRERTSHDLLGVLRDTAKAGFDGVEFAGFQGVNTQAIRNVLLETGLQVAGSCHEFTALENDLDQVVRDMQTLGCPTVVMPWLDVSLRSGASEYRRTTARLEAIGAKLRERDLKFLVHLHGYEFETFETDTGPHTGLEFILDADPELVGIEMDTYWVLQRGADPVALYRQLGPRCPSLHCKDTVSTNTWEETEAGNGIINFAALLEDFSKHGGWAIIEQEQFTRDPLESVTRGLRNLREFVSRKAHA